MLAFWAQVDQGQGSIDAKVDLFFSEIRYNWLTTFMRKVTLLGDWVGAIVAIGFVGLILYSKNFSKRTIGILSTSIAASALLGFCISQLLKVSTARPRPLDRLIEIDSYAYPSGHATTAFALYFCSALLFSRLLGSRQKQWMLAAGFIVACLIASSRLFLGVHWLSDVLAGSLLGLACAISIYRIVSRHL